MSRARHPAPPFLLVGVAVLALLSAARADAQATGADASTGQRTAAEAGASRPRRGGFRYRDELTIGGSYGNAVVINGSAPIDIGSVLFRWTRGSRSHRLFGGQPAWGFELIPYARFDQDPKAWGTGWHLLVEDRFRPEHAARPTVRIGAGMTYQNRSVPPGETRYNFSLFVGLGLAIDTGSHTAVTLEYRLHHISNADTGVRNPGINTNAVVVGVTWRH